jgi:hypothetical protein
MFFKAVATPRHIAKAGMMFFLPLFYRAKAIKNPSGRRSSQNFSMRK